MYIQLCIPHEKRIPPSPAPRRSANCGLGENVRPKLWPASMAPAPRPRKILGAPENPGEPRGTPGSPGGSRWLWRWLPKKG